MLITRFGRSFSVGALCALGFVAVGCASAGPVMIDGHPVARLTHQFSGQPFTVKHDNAHPQPGDPSGGVSGDGGSIRGRICGMFYDADVKHEGDHVQLVGSLDNRYALAIGVRGTHDALHFTGNLGGLGVEFTADPQRIEGHVGLRVILVQRVGDEYRGLLRIPGLLGNGTLGIVVHGASSLWTMPPADIAAVLPALFTCNGFHRLHIVSAISVGFGGQFTDAPPDSSSVSSGGR